MNRRFLALSLVTLLALSGCAGLGGEAENGAEPTDTDSSVVEEGVRAANSSSGATNVTYAVGITVTDTVAGEQLSAFGATFPREAFTVDSIQHDEILIGIDTDGDGTINRGFQEDAVSGINTNDYSFEVTMDSAYTLQSGDVVLVQYPDVDNPTEPGEYTVETRLNDQRMADATVLIE